ncbi:MAG: hypothetical protein KF764_27960 [Labilithrix sp.]|nr:hypothetical protein [Labilithrix sp.]
MTTGPTFVASGVARSRVRLPRILSNVFKVLYVLSGVLMLIGARTDVGEGLLLGIVATYVGFGLIFASYILSLVQTWRPRTIEITSEALVFWTPDGETERHPRSTIVGANLVRRHLPRGPSATVEVELRDGDRLTIRLDDFYAAHAITQHLGFGPGRLRSRSRLGNPVGRLLHVPIALGVHVAISIPFGILLSSISSGWELTQALTYAVEMLVYVAITHRLRPAEVEIGDDGVRLVRGSSTRFFRANDPTIRAALRGPAVDDVRTAEVLGRAAERAVSSRIDARVFDRGERSIDEWRRHIASSMEGGYRASATTADAAASVLRSAEATGDQRIGAGLALRVAGEPERLRAAIDAMADERVRVALEAVAEDRGDDALERAVTELRRAASIPGAGSGGR